MQANRSFKAGLILIFLATVILQSCDPGSKKQPLPRFFKDVMIYSLEGINATKKDNYPNVEIFDSAGHRVLVYHIDDHSSLRRDYRRIQNTWVANLFEKDDTTDIYTIRTISRNKLVEVSYTNSTGTRLYDIGVFIQDTMIYYSPGALDPHSIKTEEIPLATRSMPYKVKFWYDTSGRVLKMNKKYNEANKGLTTIVTECYHNDGRPFFDWYETQYFCKPAACK